MLNEQQLAQSLPLAQKFADEGKILIPLEQTPLEAMVSCCTTHGLYVDGRELKDYSIGQIVEHFSQTTALPAADGTNEHSAVTENFVQLAARGVASVLNIARNVVVPDIKDVLNKIQQLADGYTSVALEPFVVIQKRQNEIFSDPLLLELVERYSETPARETPQRQLPALELDTVREKIKTGSDSFDALVLQLLGDDGLSWVNETFAGNVPLSFLNPEYAVGLHLLCKTLHDDPPEGTRLSLLDYNSHLSLLMEQTGRITYQVIETARRRKKLGLLYLAPPRAHIDGYREIEVEHDLYLGLLEKGLTPEVLFGNELLGRRYQASQLLDQKDELITVYNREMRLRSSRVRLEKSAKLREYLEKVIAIIINERPDDELPIERSMLHQRLNEFLSAVNDSDFDNLPKLCRDVVCHVLYAHTDAHRVLVVMDRLGEEYPDVDPREIALMATIEYVSLWVAKQIRVDR